MISLSAKSHTVLLLIINSCILEEKPFNWFFFVFLSNGWLVFHFSPFTTTRQTALGQFTTYHFYWRVFFHAEIHWTTKKMTILWSIGLGQVKHSTTTIHYQLGVFLVCSVVIVGDRRPSFGQNYSCETTSFCFGDSGDSILQQRSIKVGCKLNKQN